MPANLAFPDNDVRLRSEFQVGIHEPADFGSEIERGGKVHAACLLHADALDDHGWRDEDPTAKAAKDEATLVARNRYLLDEFPPRGGASAGDKPVTRPTT